jgi:hypothetical protein
VEPHDRTAGAAIQKHDPEVDRRIVTVMRGIEEKVRGQPGVAGNPRIEISSKLGDHLPAYEDIVSPPIHGVELLIRVAPEAGGGRYHHAGIIYDGTDFHRLKPPRVIAYSYHLFTRDVEAATAHLVDFVRGHASSGGGAAG